GIVESGDVHGPDREMPEWGGDRTEMPQWQGLGVEEGDWQPGDVRIPEISRPEITLDSRPLFVPESPREYQPWQPDQEFQDLRNRLEQMRHEGRKRPTPGVSGPTPDTGFPEWPDQVGFGAVNPGDTGAPELPGSDPAVEGPASLPEDMTRDGMERFFERIERIAREAVERSLGHSSFVDGTDPIAEALEKHGVFIAIFLHAIAAGFTPEQIAAGAGDAVPAPSTALANQLRGMRPDAVAAIINQLGDRLADVPQIYRIALAAALADGDIRDPAIAKALATLEAFHAGGEHRPELSPLNPAEENFLTEQIINGRITLEQFIQLSELNPHLRPAVLIHRIIAYNDGREPEGLRLSETDPVPESDPTSDIAPPEDVVHRWEDIRTVLGENFGMRLVDAGEDAEKWGLSRYSEAEMCAIVNAALPYLRRIEDEHPGLLAGLSFTPYAPNPPPVIPGETGPYNGLANIDTGTIYMRHPEEFYRAYADRPIDGDTAFMLTFKHEIGHAITSQAPEQAHDFNLNLSPVAEIRGPASTNAGEDAMSMDEALETLFPHLPPEERQVRLFMHYEVRIDDGEMLNFEASGEPIPRAFTYDGTLQIYRRLPAETTDVLPLIVSNYSGTNGHEAIAEAFAHYFADRPYRAYPGTEMPHLVDATRGPLPANLQMLLERMIFVAQNRDGPRRGVDPFPDFFGDDE
ncbi:MAG: hypothetical protein JJU21_17150, partial [Salinarimonas sp.]|nr:hypothetical protein [Salinarimonas sp.]